MIACLLAILIIVGSSYEYRYIILKIFLKTTLRIMATERIISQYIFVDKKRVHNVM